MPSPTFWPPWNLFLYTDENKGTPVNTEPIVDVINVVTTEALNTPYEYVIHLMLTDPLVSGIPTTGYLELFRGVRAGVARTRVLRGYITAFTKSDDESMTYEIQCKSASWFLMTQRNLGAMVFKHAWGFDNIVQVHNGIPDGSGGYPPKHKGILRPGTNWSFEWRDVGGTYGSGTPSNTTPPGTWGPSGKNHDIWRGDWASMYMSVLSLAQENNYSTREKPGSDHGKWSGVLEGGPLGDDSGMTIWGGNPLLVDMQTNHNYPTYLTEADSRTAQELGYAVIESVQYHEGLDKIVNCAWIIGHGSPEEGGVTLAYLVGGHPLDKDNHLQNGWSILPTPPNHPGGKIIYYKSSSRTTYAGHTYLLVACEQDDRDPSVPQAGWAYGVADRTSMDKYGLSETFLAKHKITDPSWLLAAALGYLELNADPVPTYTMTVLSPLTSDASNGVPFHPAPGQTVTINYSGWVHGIKQDSSGNWVSTGNAMYLDYPGPLSTEQQTKLKRLQEVHEEYTESGEIIQQLTFGQGRFHSKFLAQHLADRMADHLKGHHVRRHGFQAKNFAHTSWIFTNNPNAFEDETRQALVLEPGSAAVTDTHNPNFFRYHRRLRWTLDVTDNLEYLDIEFAKPTDSVIAGENTLLSPNAGDIYGVFRMAFGDAGANSGVTTGFYTTIDGVTFTPRGLILANDLLDANGRMLPGVYNCELWYDGSHFQFGCSSADTDSNDQVWNTHYLAQWGDRQADDASANSHVISLYGAFGFRLHGGSSEAVITDVDIHPYMHPWHGRSTAHPHHPHKHHWHDMQFWFTGTRFSTATTVPMEMRVYGPSASLTMDNGKVIKDGLGHPATWTSNVTIYVRHGDYLIWNGAEFSVEDSVGNPILPGDFGGVDDIITTRESMNNIYLIGRVALKNDLHTGYPELIGWHNNISQSQGRQIAPGAVGRRGLNANVAARHTLQNLTLKVRKGTSLDSHHHKKGNCTARFGLHDWHANGSIITEDGTQLLGVLLAKHGPFDVTIQPDHLLVFNPTLDADGYVSSNSITLSSLQVLAENTNINGFPLDNEWNSHVIVLGKLSHDIDKHSRDYFFHHWNGGSHQKAGKHIHPKSSGRGHGHPHHPHKKKRHLPTGSAAASSVLIHNP